MKNKVMKIQHQGLDLPPFECLALNDPTIRYDMMQILQAHYCCGLLVPFDISHSFLA